MSSGPRARSRRLEREVSGGDARARRARRGRPPSRAQISRRRAVAGGLIAALVVALLAAGALGGGRASAPAAAPGTVRLLFAHRAIVLRTGAYASRGRLDARALGALVQARVPATASERKGPATITLANDRAGAIDRMARLGAAGGVLTVSARAIAASIRAPAIRQRMHNDCEATALSILLDALGRHVDQRVLQSELPRNGPPDPIQTPSGWVWGDPELGFVGRPDGGGTAGGFGVYQGPVRQVALRHGVSLLDLTGSSPARLRARLLGGHAVMAWVGLSNGPYGTWRSPAGRPLTVNYGEHAVVLTGIDDTGAVTVDNPLTGAFETWTAQEFSQRWTLLGRRALSA